MATDSPATSNAADEHFGACPHDCPDNCALVYTVQDNRLSAVRGNASHPFTAGRLCVKVNDYDRHHYHPERILYPLRRTGAKGSGAFERVSWDQALQEIGARWRKIIDTHGAEAIVPYGYAGNQGVLNGFNAGDAFFNRLGASTAEISFCASSLITAQLMTIGPSLGTDPETFVDARYIIIWGANTLSTNSHLWSFIVKARRRGARLVVIDPYRSRTAARADWHLAPRPGTDGALALALIDTIVKEGLQDADYVRNHTTGFEALAASAATCSAEAAADITGISAADIRTLAHEYAATKPAVIRVGVGIERYPGGGQAIRAIDCLPALVGAWRHRGGGLLQMPVFVPLMQERLSHPEWIAPEKRVLNLGQIGAMLSGDRPLDPPIASLLIWNANPVSQAPDSNRTIAGLRRDDLFTVISEHFMTDTAKYADIVLPATMAGEHVDVQTSWGHFYINYNAAAVAPAGESVPNAELFRRLARTMGMSDPHFDKGDDELLAEAFDWDHRWFGGKGFADLKAQGFLRIEAPLLPHAEGNFPTPSGRCEFVSELGAEAGFIGPPLRQMRSDAYIGTPIDSVPAYIPPGEGDAAHPLRLLATKSHGFLNSQYVNEPRKLAAQGEQQVLVHPDDARRFGIKDGDPIRLGNRNGSLDATAHLSTRTLPGTLTTGFGYWRSLAGGGLVNALSGTGLPGFAGTPAYYDTFVYIEPRVDAGS